MTMPDEIWAIDAERDNETGVIIDPETWSEDWFITYGTKYIRHDIHEEKIEVLRRIISGLEADIRKLKGN